MKQIILLSLAAFFAIFLSWNINSKTTINNFSQNDHFIENDTGNIDKLNGITEARNLEFDITKDVSPNYIPLSKLNASSESFASQRRLQNNQDVSLLGLNWVERGPNEDMAGPSNRNTRAGNAVTAGRVRAIFVDLADKTNQTVWVGGIDGGVWKTTNIGAAEANWQPIDDYLGNMAVSSICQDPTNPDIMYFGTGEKTANVDAVKGGGIWKSTDHGETWNFLPGTENYYNVSKMLCDSKGNVYVSIISDYLGILRSDDKGATWTIIRPGDLTARVTDMEMSSNDRLHIVCGYNMFGSNIETGYRYTDNPTAPDPTWIKPKTTFPTDGNTDLTVSGNTVYALAANTSWETPFVYKSTDGGANWKKANTTPINPEISSGLAWYCMAITADPNNAQNLVAGGLNTFRSTDGGVNWVKVGNSVGTSLSYVHADVMTGVWNGNQVILGTSGGIHLSKDGGATFKDRNKGLRIKQFYSVAAHPTDLNYFLAGSQDNGVQQLSKPGLGSSVEVTGGNGGFVHIDQNQPQYQFGSYIYNNYRRSVDGGKTWSEVNFGNMGQYINPSDYDNNTNKLYAGGNENQYVRWENPQTGATFSQVDLPALKGSVTAVAISPYTPNRVFFGSSYAKVIMTDNADGTPISIDLFKPGMGISKVSCIAIGTDDDHLMATYSDYGVEHVWVTDNGGVEWNSITGDLPDVPVHWAIYYPGDNTKAIIGTEMGIFETDKFNVSFTKWTHTSNFPFVRTDMLKYRPGDGTVVAATQGRGIFTAVIAKVLPVTLVSFTGTLENSNVVLNWKTNTELQSDYFEVQKSTDGTNFQAIGKVIAAGSSSTPQTYTYTDTKLSELNYYRLKMVDKDGKFSNSNTVLIRNEGVSQRFWITGNPFHDVIRINFERTPKTSVKFELISMNGAKVFTKEYAGANQINVHLSGHAISNGTYLLRTTAEDKTYLEKVVKQ